MRNKILLIIGASCCAASVGAAVIQNAFVSPISFARSASDEYTLVLNNSNTPSGLTPSYQNSFSGNVKTSLDNNVSMTFVNAKSLNGGFVELANHGKIYNFNSGNNQLTAVNGVELVGSGSIMFKPGINTANGGILPEITPVTVSAGAGKVTVPTCDYFEIEAGDSGAQITTLKLTYTCASADFDSKLLNGSYTGTGDDNYIYKLTVNNGTATFASLNKQTNVSYSGTASLTSKTNASISLSSGSLGYTFTYDGHNLTYASKTGSVPQISLRRVYKLQDFESYSASGQGYTDSTTKYQTTGLRSAFYADYYQSGGTGEIGGSNWPVMTFTDNITYDATKGHNSSKVGAFKFSNGTDMRYISMDSLYGVNTGFKGSKLSFWARGAYSNSSLSTDHHADIPMKAYAYYGTPLTPQTQASVREVLEFTVETGSHWQHFELPLNTGRTYYGFGFYAKQSTGSTAYVPFDDFEIYTDSPYAEYEDPAPANYPQGTFKGTFKTSRTGSNLNIVIAIGNYHNGIVSVLLNNVSDAHATGITFNESTNAISIPTTGSFNSKSIGTITGTYNASTGVISNLKSSAFYTSGSYSATKVATGNTFYDCEGTTAELQSQFKRRYMSGSWQVDTGNADRITHNGVEYASGSGALKRRGYGSGAVALNLNNDFSSTISVTILSFWVYNPSDSNIDLRCWVYKATGLNTNAEMTAGIKTANAYSWTYCSFYVVSGSSPVANNIYNFQIADFTNSGVYLTFDNIYLY